MKGLLFLSRLALICNLLFLVCLVMQRTHDMIAVESIRSIIIILGWFLAPFINLLANIGYLIRLLKKSEMNLPVWLGVTNILFLFFQFFIYFILP